MKIFITGGCGYKGSLLIKRLLKLNYKITNYDTRWFGNFLPKHKNLKNTKGDIRNLENISLKKFNAVIHLASVSNDPCSDLNPKLSWEIGPLASMKLIEKAINDGVKKFIYASSGSVYGIKKERNVTEELSLKPISDYNKTKMTTERVLLSYKNKIDLIIIRPATVCGLSPRMRFDLSVNVLTINALQKKLITVFGGNQVRPNIHIDDLIDLYIFFLKNNKVGIYNAGFENIKILDIAKLIQKKTKCKIKILKSNDPRSYRLSSKKLLKIGYKPKKTVDNAINEIINSYNNGFIKNNLSNNNLKWMILKKFQ